MARDRDLPICRSQENGEFVYRRRGQRITNERELARIAALAIPPAWQDVEIARNPAAKILARAGNPSNASLLTPGSSRLSVT